MKPNGLFFAFGNTKLVKGQVIFSLPAGYSCPFADKCQSFANRKTGQITDGANTEHRCYAASLETRPNVRNAHWRNFEAIRKAKTLAGMTDLLAKELPYGLIYRIHSSGDFFSQDYFDAWVNMAWMFPERTFYAYTKALPFWVKRLGMLPSNFILTASYGGTFDHLISDYNLKYCKIVKNKAEAKTLGLKIDHDDSLAWQQNKSFALLVHGTQPAGTIWAKAWALIKRAKKRRVSNA